MLTIVLQVDRPTGQATYEKQALLDRLSIYKLLIVDDLGVERDSAYDCRDCIVTEWKENLRDTP